MLKSLYRCVVDELTIRKRVHKRKHYFSRLHKYLYVYTCSMDTIQQMLNALRSRGLTLRKIAAATGLAYSTVNNMANGQRGREPSMRVYSKIKALCDLHADDPVVK